MKNIEKTIMLTVLVMALAACATFAPVPTETPASTQTNLPTSTHTPVPTNTPTKTPVPPTETASMPLPSGTPASEWEGFPVMPEAIAGDGDSQGYSFTIHATPAEIQKFYETALAKLGWSLFASGQGAAKDTVLLIFMKDASTLTISILPQPDGILYVLLVK